MNDMRRIGGFGALAGASTFIFGFILFGTALTDYTSGDPTPAESVAFLVDNQSILRLWNIVIYVVFGIALVPLVLALHDLLKSQWQAISQIGAAFGLIWVGLVIATGMVASIGIGTVADLEEAGSSAAEPVWSALDSVQNGLGGGNEIVGGLWVLLVSWAALQVDALPKFVNYLGLAAGIAGIVTVVPALELVGAIFGLGLIVWFIWVGLILVRRTGI